MALKEITSIKDDKVIEARQLSAASGRNKLNKILLYDSDSIRWAHEANIHIEHVFYYIKAADVQFLSWLSQNKIDCYAVSKGILMKIAETSHIIPYVGVAVLPEIPEDEYARDDLVVILDDVKDHGNIGTIIRTASAFGVQTILSVGSDGDIYYKNIVNAARGNTFRIKYKQFSTSIEIIEFLRKHDYKIVTTSPYGTVDISGLEFSSSRLAIVFGNETKGVSEEIKKHCDISVRITMADNVESLNVGVAAGIVLYEIRKKLLNKT